MTRQVLSLLKERQQYHSQGHNGDGEEVRFSYETDQINEELTKNIFKMVDMDGLTVPVKDGHDTTARSGKTRHEDLTMIDTQI